MRWSRNPARHKTDPGMQTIRSMAFAALSLVCAAHTATADDDVAAFSVEVRPSPDFILPKDGENG